MLPKRWQDSATETVQVVLPNDSNPLGFMLGGSVMHLIDITGAIACHRHTNTLASPRRWTAWSSCTRSRWATW